MDDVRESRNLLAKIHRAFCTSAVASRHSDGGLLPPPVPLLQTIVHQLVGLKAISINSNSRRRNEHSLRESGIRERGRWKLDRIRDEMEPLLLSTE